LKFEFSLINNNNNNNNYYYYYYLIFIIELLENIVNIQSYMFIFNILVFFIKDMQIIILINDLVRINYIDLNISFYELVL